MSVKQLQVNIQSTDLSALKRGRYRFCVAKKMVDSQFSVVWYAASNYFNCNVLKWQESFELFAMQGFSPGKPVAPSTNPVQIALGQTSILNAAGVLEQPKAGGPTKAITLVSEVGGIHPGLSQGVTGFDGVRSVAPMFVTKHPVVRGSTELKPVDKLLLWFGTSVKSGDMLGKLPPIETSRANSMGSSFGVIVDCTSGSDQTVRYANQQWTVG